MTSSSSSMSEIKVPVCAACGSRYITQVTINNWNMEAQIWHTEKDAVFFSCPFCAEVDISWLTADIEYRCPRGHRVFEETNPELDYPFFCMDCDENFYSFELTKHNRCQ